MPNDLPKSVVFITGTFLGSNCWDVWKGYFEGSGYTCIVPPWPFKEAAPEELRNKPSIDAIAWNTLDSVTEHFASVVSDLPGKPILIGHSLGGLIVQLLLQRRLGKAGVAIHSFPPRGVHGSRFTLLQTLRDTMGFFTSAHKTYLMPFRKWKKQFANGMECDEQKELYYKYAVPESKMIVRDALICTPKIDFTAQRPPLLIVSGGRDLLIPASVNYSNYEKYRPGNSVTDYKEFKQSNHLVFDGASASDEAECVIEWLQELS